MIAAVAGGSASKRTNTVNGEAKRLLQIIYVP
jgi:hypothetical protein